jgi:hypothetical protein
MKNIILKALFVFSVLSGSVLMNSCDDGYKSIDTKKLAREEKELMEDYLKNGARDSLKEISDTVIDKLEDLGYLFFGRKKGTGDSIKVGMTVGFRYKFNLISRDSTGIPFSFPYGDNYSEEKPKIYTFGTTDVYSGIYPGLNYAIGHMTYGSEATIVVLSDTWTIRDYVPSVIDLKVTYVEK